MNDRLPADERLSALEAAAGVVVGSDSPAALPRPTGSPLEALERRILPALERPPCLVSFPGGRDSSALLALASRLARREGLPAPVPATLRFRGAGIDPELVDPDELRRSWPEAEHDGRLLTVLQSVWLATEETQSGSGNAQNTGVSRQTPQTSLSASHISPIVT